MKYTADRHPITLTIASLCTVVIFGCLGPVRPKGPNQTKSVTARPVSRPPDCPQDKAIVSLTYDDGLASQIAVAIPQLDEFGFRGTFFLNDLSAYPDKWQQAAAEGHELGSHTINHPCTADFDWVKRGNASEDFDLQRMEGELDEQLRGLTALGQAPPYSFAYPCGTTWVGKAHKSYVPLIEQRFIAARGVEGNIVTERFEPMLVPAYFFEGAADLFIERIQAAIQLKGWVVFGFHGVGGDYLAVSSDDHRAVLQWLSAYKDEVVVLPFGEAARCTKD